MLKNIGDIYNYTNEKLLSDELTSVNDIIEYLEEAQNIIVEKFPLEAPIFSLTLTNNQFTLPDDFAAINNLTVDKAAVTPDDVWNKVVTLPKDITSGSLELRYYRKPNALDPSNLAQIPDVEPRFFIMMAKYAAKMYYLADDDAEMREAFKTDFADNLNFYSNPTVNRKSNFKNLW
jgi:hypothetical protein